MTAKPKTTRTRKPASAARSKTTAARKPAPLRAAVAESPAEASLEDSITQSIKPVIDGSSSASEQTAPEMKRPELIAKVMERVDTKKKDAKPVVEAMLAVLGETLAEGRELNLQPLGKVKLNRVKQTNNGRIMVVKIRQPHPRQVAAEDAGAQETGDTSKEAVAQPEE